MPDFQPSSVMFKSSQKWQILVSDVGVILMFAVLGFWGYKRSFTEVMVMYGIPYLWVNK
jgi:omega-6 fatty acid desaturase / acyl-lipid omega-6 desaturase (Delta-12 desaturase)